MHATLGQTQNECVDYDAVLAELATWAEETDHVRALLLTGSAATGDAHPLSDRDVEIYTRDVDALLADDSWWASMGEVLVVERLEDDLDRPTRLIYYAGGKLDFTVIAAEELPTAAHARPRRVLVDKDHAASATLHTAPPGPLPDRETFDEALHWGYAAALMCAKSVVRDEPWSAKVRDHVLKTELLRIIEWDHRVRYGAAVDTRYLGTRMSTWMDADVRDELSHCWGHFDADDTARALRRTTALFARLAQRVARALDLPAFPHDRLHAEIDHILGMRG